ncbi:MAG: OmpA family protein [Amylibacter sp.]|jgi:outer membrane protein OmpA-like peptidoglycan-associated protein|tara:strand:+ start:9723 stop:10355 length:633 start_codon:yes stop_codon:yes gene_type:complete
MLNYFKPIFILLLSVFTLISCTEDPFNTKKGAIIGATAGVMSGLLTGDDSNGTIKRALAGAALGAAIGNELDIQEEELRKDLGGSGALIKNTGDSLIVTLPEAITFDINSSTVRYTLEDSLVRLAKSLNKYPNTNIDVIGHTDNVGDESYNQELSARRAGSVAAILAQSGVSQSRMRAYGRGELKPIKSNDTVNGRAANRRVDIIITPTD